MPSNKLENKYIDATKYEIRALWTGVDVGHMSEDVEVINVGYPLEPPDDLGGWFLVSCQPHEEHQDCFFTTWVREKLKVKAKKTAAKKRTAATPPKVPADIQAIKDEAAEMLASPIPPKKKPIPPKKKRGRPSKKNTEQNGTASEQKDLPEPVASLPQYDGP